MGLVRTFHRRGAGGTQAAAVGLTSLALLVAPVVAGTPAHAAAAASAPDTVGLYGSADPTYDGVYRQSLAILGLHAAGRTAAPEAVAWLRRQQCADGGFSSYNPTPTAPCPAYDAATFSGGADTNATAVAVPALLAAGRWRAAERAARWLRGVQNADGGWSYTPGHTGSDPNSTGLVLTALRAAGLTPADTGTSAVGYLAALQAGRADFAGTNPADRGGIASPWSAGVPDVRATVQALPGLAGADLLSTPGGSPWRDSVNPPAAVVPPATAEGVSHWATTWLAAEAAADRVPGTSAPWAVLSFAWDRHGEVAANDLYDDLVHGQVPAANPGANGQAALAAAALGRHADVAAYATAIAATLRADTTGPTTKVVTPRAPRKASSWKPLRVRAIDATGVARVRVAVSQKRSGTWWAYDGITWHRVKRSTSTPWLDARATSGAWRYWVRGIQRGSLVVRARSVDVIGNVGRTTKTTQKITAKR